MCADAYTLYTYFFFLKRLFALFAVITFENIHTDTHLHRFMPILTYIFIYLGKIQGEVPTCRCGGVEDGD